MNRTFIPPAKFEEMTKVVSCNSIVTKGCVLKTVQFDDNEWVVTGGMSSGRDGWIEVDAYQVIDFEKYEGEIPPLTYARHTDEISLGKRERSYDGLLVKYGSRLLVLTGQKKYFKPKTAAQQANSAKKEIIIPGFKNYDGGKSGDGTYQTLINHVPPHGVKIIPFAGMCGLTRFIRPARLNIINDLDISVIDAWEKAVGHRDDFRLFSVDAIEYFLSGIAQLFDTADTFIYLDPPYPFDSRRGDRPLYKFNMNNEQEHVRMLNIAKGFMHARIMISSYQNKLYDEVLQGWYVVDYYSKTHQGMAMERIYMNYTPTELLHDYSFIGKDYREREALARQKKNFLQKVNNLDPRLRNALFTELIDTASKNNAIQDMKLYQNDTLTMKDSMNVIGLAKYCGGYRQKFVSV